MRLGLGLGLGRTNNLTARRRPKSTQEVLFELEDIKQASIWIPDIEAEIIEHLKRDPQQIYELTPRKFEELIASIFRNQGFDTTLTPESKDGGYDIIAVNHNSFTGKNKYLIECKRYQRQNPVGVSIIRGLYGVLCTENATKGLVVTSSHFTKGARDFESRNIERVSLHDYNVLTEWVKNIKS